jgi:hypothetical protein
LEMPLTLTMLSLQAMVWLSLMPAALGLPPTGGKGDGGAVEAGAGCRVWSVGQAI